MRKGLRLLGGCVPGLDALEDRHLLSRFGGMGLPDRGGFGGAADFAPQSPSPQPVAPQFATSPTFTPHFADHTPGTFEGPGSWVSAPHAFDPSSWSAGDHHFSPFGGMRSSFPSPAAASGDAYPSSMDHGPRMDPATDIATVNVLTPSGVGIPASEAATFLDHSAALAAIETFLSLPDRSGPIALSFGRFGPGPRSFDEPSIALTSTRPVTPTEPQVIVAPENASAAALASASHQAGPQQANVAVSAEAVPVAQAIASALISTTIAPSFGLPHAGPAEPVPQVPRGNGPGVTNPADPGSVTVTRGQDPAEVPSPQSADLIAEMTPFEEESFEETVARLVERFESLGAPLMEQTAEGLPHLVPVVTALAAFEVARRWHKRRTNSPSIRAWKTRSSVLRGFF